MSSRFEVVLVTFSEQSKLHAVSLVQVLGYVQEGRRKPEMDAR